MSIKADGKPGGVNADVQFNDHGAFAGAPILTYDKATGALTLDSRLLNHALIGGIYATGTFTLAVQPDVGDTITIGGLTYTYTNNVGVQGEIAIGVDLAETQARTVPAVNVGIGATLPDAGIITFIANVSTVSAGPPGTAGNGIATTSTFANPANHFGQLALSGGVDGSTNGHLQAQTIKLTGASPASTMLWLQTAPGQDETEINILDITDSDGNSYLKIDGGGDLYALRAVRMVDPDNNSNFTIQTDGQVFFRIPDIDDAMHVFVKSSIPFGNDTLVFAVRPNVTRTVLIAAAAAGAVALEIDTAGVDNTDLIQALGNANFDVVFRLMQSGAVVIAQHTVPADGDLSTGDMALWFDQTPNAAQLMIKAKDSNGSVVTGAVALS